ncbi:hypothetical protein ACEQ8H_002158 [Pleosporales sp. CAS-2024a]
MTSLSELYIAIVDPSPQGIWEQNWLELEDQLLHPVKNVTRPSHFVLILPFASCRTELDMGESRVVLRTPESWVMEEEEEEEDDS